MNSSHSSKLVAFLVVATLLFAAVAPAAAVSASGENVPDEAAVGEKVSATFTLTELYTDYEQWTVNGETGLTQVTWTVTKYDQADNKVGQEEYDGASFNQSVDLENDVGRVTVEVTGTVPEVENYTYDPAQTFGLATLNQVREGGTNDEIGTWEVHSYTDESAEARDEIDAAAATIDDAESSGASVSDAESTLENAVSSFENENFANAVDIANKAEENAASSQQSSRTMQMALYAGVGLVAVGTVVGGVLWWRSRQDSYDKLG